MTTQVVSRISTVYRSLWDINLGSVLGKYLQHYAFFSFLLLSFFFLVGINYYTH